MERVWESWQPVEYSSSDSAEHSNQHTHLPGKFKEYFKSEYLNSTHMLWKGVFETKRKVSQNKQCQNYRYQNLIQYLELLIYVPNG